MNITCVFTLNGQTWRDWSAWSMSEIYILHQMKRHGIAILNGETELDDDAIDYLSMQGRMARFD